jgi:hypothetical protein
MRGCRRQFIVTLVAAVAASGCARSASDENRPAQSLPAPKDPDLGSVMERFYEQVEGLHWRFAYAMLAPAYRTRLSQDDLVRLYDGYASADVNLRQQSDSIVVARIVTADPTTGQPRTVEETATLVWEGTDWQIAAIRRRAL